MTHSRNRSRWVALVLSTGLALVAGCAFEEGNPWARADFSSVVAFDEAGRSDGDRLSTSRNYEVELEGLIVEIGALSLTAGAANAVDFDPANPPEGFSLCHNGHCHSDDGQLVDYDEIAASLGGASSLEITSTVEKALAIGTGEGLVRGDDCGGTACELPRGALTSSRIFVGSITLTGRAFETLDDARIPEEGVDFDIEVAVDQQLQTPLDGIVGEELTGDVDVTGELVISASLLDAIDFSDLDSASSEVASEFAEEVSWTTTVSSD